MWIIANDLQNLGKFFDDQVADPKWHLVFEFISGLDGDLKKEKK